MAKATVNTTVTESNGATNVTESRTARPTLAKQYDDSRSVYGDVRARAIREESQRTGKPNSKTGIFSASESVKFKGHCRNKEEFRKIMLKHEVESLSTLLAKLEACKKAICLYSEGAYTVDEITPEAFVSND